MHFSHGLPGEKTFLRLTHGCTAYEKWDEAMSPEGSVPSLLRQVGLREVMEATLMIQLKPSPSRAFLKVSVMPLSPGAIATRALHFFHNWIVCDND